jgi:hypothetical protein
MRRSASAQFGSSHVQSAASAYLGDGKLIADDIVGPAVVADKSLPSWSGSDWRSCGGSPFGGDAANELEKLADGPGIVDTEIDSPTLSCRILVAARHCLGRPREGEE